MTPRSEFHINRGIEGIKNSPRIDLKHQFFRTLGLIDGFFLCNEIDAQEYGVFLDTAREIHTNRRAHFEMKS